MQNPKLVKRGKNYAAEYWDENKGFTTRSSLGTDDPGLASRRFAEFCLKNVHPKKADTSEVYVEGLVAQLYVVAKDFPSRYVYKSALAYCSEYLKGMSLKAFDKRAQEHFVATLREDGLSDGTISRMMAVIGRAVKRAWEYGEIESKPYILSVPAHNPRQRIYTDDEMRAILQSLKTENEKRFVSLAILTAARPQAIIDLHSSQFDTKRKLLDLNPKGRKQSPKKYRPTIPLCQALLNLASTFRDGAIFVVGTDQLASSRSIVGKINWPEGGTAYTIRHTVATELRSQGVPEFEVSGYLGHKPPGVNSVTLDYAKYRPEFMRKAADAIDAYWNRLNGLCVEPDRTEHEGTAG